jgi:hypothetical protein
LLELKDTKMDETLSAFTAIKTENTAEATNARKITLQNWDDTEHSDGDGPATGTGNVVTVGHSAYDCNILSERKSYQVATARS